MDPIRIYEYLEIARGRIFDWARPLSAEQHATAFPIGLGTLGRTLTHIMICEWFYVQRIEQRTVPPYAQWPIKDEDPPPLAMLEAEWKKQAERTRATIRAVGDWDAVIEYPGLDPARPVIVTTSAAGIFTQLTLHEVHHRAQAMAMLRGLGVAAEDIDYNALMYQRREAVGS